MVLLDEVRELPRGKVNRVCNGARLLVQVLLEAS